MIGTKTIIILVAMIILILLWSITYLTSKSINQKPLKVICHRTNSGGFPENSIPGISDALMYNIFGIEVDVRKTIDNKLILIHDKTLERTTNANLNVSETDYDTASKIHLSGDSKATIPSLEQAADLFSNDKTRLIIDMKQPFNSDEMISIVNSYNLPSNTIFISFDHEFIDGLDNKYETGLLTYNSFSAPTECPCDYLMVAWPLLIIDPSYIKRAHDKNIEVVAWTVNSEFIMKMLISLGVDGITTDKHKLATKLSKLRN